MCSTWIWIFMNQSLEAHMCCLLYRGKSICNAGFQGAHLVSCCSRVTASHFINPTSDTREVWKLFGYSKVQVCSSWLGWRNSKDTKKSLSVNNNEHPWRKMTKHEQKSREQIMSHARTWHTRLFAQGWTGWTGGWTGWLASEGGPSSRGPKLDMRWQWAVNHLQHACTVVPVVIINSHLLKQFSRLKSASDMISFISSDCSDLTIFHWFNPSPYNSVLQHCTILRLHVNKRLQF